LKKVHTPSEDPCVIPEDVSVEVSITVADWDDVEQAVEL
jgi:hypothetical protein